MKKIVLLLLQSFIYTALTNSQYHSVLIDSRNNQEYPTVKIGNQIWMAKNLNYGSMVNSSTSQADNSIVEKYCYNNNEANCTIYGGLYQWEELLDYNHNESNDGICPEGWYVPSIEDWNQMVKYLGGPEVAGGHLKSTGVDLWLAPNTGATNSSGFSAIPGSKLINFGSYSNFDALGAGSFWWSSSKTGPVGAWNVFLGFSSIGVGFNSINLLDAHSVRCIKKEPLVIELLGTNLTAIGSNDGIIRVNVIYGKEPFSYQWSNGQNSNEIKNLSAGIYSVKVTDEFGFTKTDSIRIYDTFIDDRDFKRYKAIQIGDQMWMAENLNYGIMIDGAGNQSNNSVPEKYCYQNSELNCLKYGGLYQWSELIQYSDVPKNQGLCPRGWRVPSDEDWKILEINLGMTPEDAEIVGNIRGTDEGALLRSKFESGFDALMSGYRLYVNGSFIHNSLSEYFWTSTFYQGEAWMREIQSNDSKIIRTTRNIENGKSVRCVKEVTPCSSFFGHVSISNISCNNGENGGILIIVEGGNPPFNYAWSGPNGFKDGEASISGLISGVYKVVFSDASNCKDSISVTLENPEPISWNPLLSDYNGFNIECHGDLGGSINPNVAGQGNPDNYTYQWMGPGNFSAQSRLISNLKAGEYTLTVKDMANCENTLSVNLTEPEEVLTGNITGKTNSRPNEADLYSVALREGSVYTWSVSGGNFISQQGLNFINVQWGNGPQGLISVKEKTINDCEGPLVSLNVGIYPLGIKPDEGQTGMKVYPNPSSNYCIIEFPNDDARVYQLKLYDLSGRLVKRMDQITTSTVQLMHEGLTAGFYILEIEGEMTYRSAIQIQNE